MKLRGEFKKGKRDILHRLWTYFTHLSNLSDAVAKALGFQHVVRWAGIFNIASRSTVLLIPSA